MCDYFPQRMDDSQGDLADIITNRSLAGASETATVLPTGSNGWMVQVDPIATFPLPAGDIFPDPFVDSGDLLLHELARTRLFDSSEASGGGGARKMLLWKGEKNKSSSPFSTTPQTSRETGKCSAMNGPQSLLALDGEISSPRLTTGTKRRKSQAKKVVCVPAPATTSGKTSGEVVPSDLWAWRKYGQKPIKGSPYPRGYYRCSSSKGCPARKQVERSRTDPNMLVITYSSEHNHPWPTQKNVLAGCTRSQPPKTNNSPSTSKNSPQNHHKQFIANMKEEPKESSSTSTPLLVKEEAYEEMDKAWADPQDYVFDQVYDESFNVDQMLDSNHPDDFFADLAELETDPMNLVFFNQERVSSINNNKAMNPFDMFDWGEHSSFGEAKRGL